MTATTIEPQPRAFYVIFFVEMWERFGYYGLQALLVLYLSKAMHFTDSEAYGTFAAFAALVYATPILGGYVADKLLGYQRTLMLGASLLTMGYALLAIPFDALDPHLELTMFYLALGVIVAGNGFFKTSPSSLVGKLYSARDSRTDSAFTLFYMSVNIGSFLSMLFCGYIAHYFGWHAGFALCAVGMSLGLLTFILRRRILGHLGSAADTRPIRMYLLIPVLLGALVVIVAASLLIHYLTITQWVLITVGMGAIIFYAVLGFKSEKVERARLTACFILTLFAIVFFCLYFQAPQSMNLFVERNVNHHLFSWFYLSTPSFQALNPFFILVLAPMLSQVYLRMSRRQGDFSIPTKFAVGIVITGVGFIILYLSHYYANAQGIVSPWWVVLAYFFQTLGELFVSALGPAMITKLAPPRYLAIMMGTWFLASAAAAFLSGQLAKLTSIPDNITQATQTLPIYTNVFLKFGWITIAFGIFAFIAVPFLQRLILGTRGKALDRAVHNPVA